MKKITVDALAELSNKLDEFVEQEIGEQVPFVALLATPTGGLCFFTNRRDNDDARAMLEVALESLDKQSNAFIDVDEQYFQ